MMHSTRLMPKTVNMLALICLALLGQVCSAAETPRLDGAALFARNCAACHAAGPGHPGTSALAIKYRDTDQPPVLQDRQDLTPELVKVFVRYGAGAMPFFRKTEISDVELERIGRYLQKKP